MPLMVYLDETGDHNMDKIAPEYPVFGVIMVIVDTDTYVHTIIPAFCKMKIALWGHEGVILHSYDIRKKQKQFALLNNSARFEQFIAQVNPLMEVEYNLIGAFIRTDHHKARYGANAGNPYHLSLVFALERLTPLLEAHRQTEVQIVAESRGKREDNDFRREFYQFASSGSEHITQSRVKAIDFRLSFCAKSANLIGMQIADLAAYPTGRYVIDPTKPNPNFDLIQPKFYEETGTLQGLKIFP